jgi:hypothetical protein
MHFLRRSDKIFLAAKDQIRNWRRASRKMKWKISKEAFEAVNSFSANNQLSEDRICGTVLCYGFGDDGAGASDAVLSGRLTWQYALKRWKNRTWQCEYIDFDKSDHIRLFPEAPSRPKGFYLCDICIPKAVQKLTVSTFRKNRGDWTGLGPEGLQLLIVTHPHLQQALNSRELPCLAFADYDVAPHGFYDFYDAVQMFCSNDKLGLGIGNVDRDYPMFAIPSLKLTD